MRVNTEVVSSHRWMHRPMMSQLGLYDPTTIMNGDQLSRAMREGWIKMAFYLITFFWYLYSMIYELVNSSDKWARAAHRSFVYKSKRTIVWCGLDSTCISYMPEQSFAVIVIAVTACLRVKQWGFSVSMVFCWYPTKANALTWFLVTNFVSIHILFLINYKIQFSKLKDWQWYCWGLISTD